MVKYIIIFSSLAEKDKKLLKQAGLELKTKSILTKMETNPFINPPKYERLQGNLQGFYSRRINIKHRIVYEVFEDIKVIRILRMWTHYGK